MASPHAEFVIVGAGPAGSTLATRLARAGRDVLLVDQHATPPERVGESLLPFGSRIIEALGIDMGGFQRKEGALFCRGTQAVRFAFADAARTRWTHAWQVRRSRFDAAIKSAAEQSGARFLTARVERFEVPGGVHTDRGPVTGEWVIDAGGVRQQLARQLDLRVPHPTLRTQARFAHYTGVLQHADADAGDVVIGCFDGGWLWLIPFGDGTTSVGAVATAESGLHGADLLERALLGCPAVGALMTSAERQGPMQGVHDYAACSSAFSGDGWALVGDAAIFVDPVFSSGVLLAMEGADRLATALIEGHDLARWEADVRSASNQFEAAIQAFYDGTFLDVAFAPEDTQRASVRAILTSLLAGDVFDPGYRHPSRIVSRMGDLAQRITPR